MRFRQASKIFAILAMATLLGGTTLATPDMSRAKVGSSPGADPDGGSAVQDEIAGPAFLIKPQHVASEAASPFGGRSCPIRPNQAR